jgi:hypothetical protein
MSRFFLLPTPSNDSADFGSHLKSSLIEKGWLETDSFVDATHVFVLEHPRIFSKSYFRLRRSRAERILIRFEPVAVNPIIYKKHVQNLYQKVVNVGSKSHHGVPNVAIRWPYLSHPNPARPNSKTMLGAPARIQDLLDTHARKRRACAILSNKIAWSSPSFYHLRRQMVFNANNLNIDVFGTGWQKSRIRRLRENLWMYFFLFSQLCFLNPFLVFQNLSFRPLVQIDEIENKFEVLANYEFCLVIENAPNYVSEKVIDAFVAGTIPIYVGTEIENFGIPEDAFIAAQGSREDLRVTLERLAEIDTKLVRSTILDFMLSPQGFQLWHPKEVARDIVRLCLTP